VSGIICVVSCGKLKQDRPAAAGEFYLGAYHRGCLAAALSAVGEDRSRVFILSGKYGLVSLDTRLEPYEQRVDRSGAVGFARVYRQADALGLLNCSVFVFGGSGYVSLCCRVFGSDRVVGVLAGMGGIGEQLAWLKERGFLSGLPAAQRRQLQAAATPLLDP
jgi:hypothetical protein